MTMSLQDLRRELEKVHDILKVVDRHFTREAEMNAALHMAEAVRPAPLAMAVKEANDTLDIVIGDLMGPV